jgi:hypothetical protein
MSKICLMVHLTFSRQAYGKKFLSVPRNLRLGYFCIRLIFKTESSKFLMMILWCTSLSDDNASPKVLKTMYICMYVCCRPAQVVKVLYAVAILFSYGLQFYIPTSIIWPTIEEKVPKGLENVAQNSFRVVTVICTGKMPMDTASRNFNIYFATCNEL